jgi:hypothetical protein
VVLQPPEVREAAIQLLELAADAEYESDGV